MRPSSDILRFIRNTLAVAALFVPFILLYLWVDPFKAVWHYDSYYPHHVCGGPLLNTGMVAVENFNNRFDSVGYNSFVLGNSRAFYYRLAHWSKYLPEDAIPYHFEAADESLLAVERKLAYIDRRGAQIHDVMIVLDPWLLDKEVATPSPHFMLPAKLGGPVNAVRFHTSSFAAFMDPPVIVATVDFRLHGVFKAYMRKGHSRTHFVPHEHYYDPVGNEYDYFAYEQQIADSIYYNARRMRSFEGVQHPDSITPPVVGEKQLKMLCSIKAIFYRHKTRVKIIISPTYDQIRINPADLAILKDLFGEGNVYDFSGPNEWNADYHNYYESYHYRYHVADQVMDRVYDKQKRARWQKR